MLCCSTRDNGSSVTIPTTEPLSFRAGETVIWTKTFADFSAAASWVLAYTLVNAANRYATITVITDPLDATGFKATLSATNSALIVAGTYQIVGLVSKAGEIFQVVDVPITVQPVITGVYDPRSTVKIALDNINAALTAISSGAVASYSISVGNSSRTITRQNMAEFIPLRDRLQREYNTELRTAEFARTGINTSRIGIRFARL